MELDSEQFNEVLARCLAGEGSVDEFALLYKILSDNPDLKAEYELVSLLFGKAKNEVGSPDKRHFNRICKRLEDEGLM